jgi:parallel beta-helix repeat protein
MKRYITAAILILTAFACTAGADDRHVNSGESIQAEINSAITGDTIHVHAGTYTENVIVNKTLTLRGDGADVVTVQASSSSDHVFEVTVDRVNISGFTVTGATGPYKAGMYLNRDADHCNISDNSVSGNYRGIYPHLSDYNTFTNNCASQNDYGFDLSFSRGNNIIGGNTLTDNDCGIYVFTPMSERYNNSIDTSNTVNGKPVYYFYDVHDLVISGVDITHLTIASSTNVTVADSSISGGDGVHLGFVSDSTIIGNTVSDNYRGLFVGGYSQVGPSSEDNIITGNTFSNSIEEGIRIDTAGDGIFLDNTISGNSKDGIYLTNHRSNVFNNNTISDNSGNGVYLNLADDSVLTNNTISGNGDGIYMRGSTNNTFTSNTISNNGAGLVMAGWSGILTEDNRFYNNYLANTVNACDDGTGANAWNTTNTTEVNIVGGPFVGGNYWSDYAGTDANGDGFGEAAHNIAGSLNQDYLPLVYVPATCGDITGDGTIDTVDLVLLLKHCVDPAGNPLAHKCTGDVDGNGHINSLDVLMLMGYINNPEGYSLHCGC